MNVKMLRQIQKIIADEPNRFMMVTWCDTLTSPEENCGTAFCIAGWATAIEHELSGKTYRHIMNHHNGGDFWMNEGRRILGITFEQAQRLFGRANWPTRFLRKSSGVHENTPEFARIGVEVIEDFIQTDGWKNVPENYFLPHWIEPEVEPEPEPEPEGTELRISLRIPEANR